MYHEQKKSISNVSLMSRYDAKQQQGIDAAEEIQN